MRHWCLEYQYIFLLNKNSLNAYCALYALISELRYWYGSCTHGTQEKEKSARLLDSGLSPTID
jgi:hypothetical protein